MKNLKILRKFFDLTQKELAKKLSVDEITIIRYEKGSISPYFDNLLKIVNIFQISLDFLILVENCNYIRNINFLRVSKKFNDICIIEDKKHIEKAVKFLIKNKKKQSLKIKEDNINIKLIDEFHTNLKTVRNYRQFTQQQLADKIDVSRALLAQYEKKNYPPIDKLIKLSQVLDISIHALATGEKLNFEFADEEFGNTILLADQLLPLEDHKILIRLMEAMLS